MKYSSSHDNSIYSLLRLLISLSLTKSTNIADTALLAISYIGRRRNRFRDRALW
jgi:hypothetical protein